MSREGIFAISNAAGYPRFADGLTVLASSHVALPVWRLSVECRVIERKTLPVFSEFCLKSIEAGVATTAEIAAFLDIPQGAVVDVLADLYQAGYIIGSTGVHSTFHLTSPGRQALNDLIEVRPIQKTLLFHVDSLTGVISKMDRVALMNARQVETAGLMPIPTPVSEVPDLSLVEEDTIAAAFDASKTDDSTFLGFLSQSDKSERLYLPAQLVVTRSIDDDSSMGAVIFVDGRLSDAHSLAFLANDLLAALVAGKLFAADTNRLLGAAGVSRESVADADQMVERTLQASRSLESPRLSTRLTTDRILKNVDNAVERAEETLYASNLRWTHVLEHDALFERAVGSATLDFLVGLSRVNWDRWIEVLRPALASCVESGVRVRLAFPAEAARGARAELEDFLEDANAIGCELFHSGDGVLSYLVVDQEWAAISATSWGTAEGRGLSRLTLGRGLYSTDPTVVERVSSLATTA